MPYSQFNTISKIKDTFGIKTVEGVVFFPQLEPITPSDTLTDYLNLSLPLAAAGSEKARSELIIAPVLLEIRRILGNEISLFSGEEFTVDESIGLNGICDFIISHSPELLAIEAPVIVLIEAKKADLTPGIGQCIAEMIAAQRFNEQKNQSITTIYGVVSSGILWRFMKLQGKTVTIDLTDYPLQPVEQILAFLVWMAKTPISAS